MGQFEFIREENTRSCHEEQVSRNWTTKVVRASCIIWDREHLIDFIITFRMTIHNEDNTYTFFLSVAGISLKTMNVT